MCLAVAPTFLTPGVDGGRSFRLLYMGDRKRWVHLDVQAHAETTDTETGRWMDRTEGSKTGGVVDGEELDKRFRGLVGAGGRIK